MDNTTASTKDNRDVEIKRTRKKDKRFQYEEIARAYTDYLRRSSVPGDGKENGNDAV